MIKFSKSAIENSSIHNHTQWLVWKWLEKTYKPGEVFTRNMIIEKCPALKTIAERTAKDHVSLYLRYWLLVHPEHIEKIKKGDYQLLKTDRLVQHLEKEPDDDKKVS